MMTLHDLEGTRRSLAMAPLSRDEADRVLDTCTALLRERQQIVDLLDRLPTSFGEVRAVLNELQRIVTA